MKLRGEHEDCFSMMDNVRTEDQTGSDDD